MKASYSWLKDYVDVKLDPAKLAELLTMAGVSVTSCKKISGDYIFEFEITANRPDCLSVIGIAREVAALLGKKLKVPKELGPGTFGPGPDGYKRMDLVQKKLDPVQITIKDPELCPRYTARVIKNVDVKPSPDRIRERVISVGLRPVNNIVDITNFVLFETGQPLHAFDLDKLKGSICVRRAGAGEKIITIDNIPRTLAEGTLVIADEFGPVAIAGVMGGVRTEVTRLTKNILVESAFFNPVSVRKTSRALGITSESSYRFERKVDSRMVSGASGRASALVQEIAGGEIKAFTDVGRKSVYSKAIKFNPEKANSLLGISLKKLRAARILKSLGFSVKEKKGAMSVTPPSFREDVKNEIDITEEVARIYGYENIPLTIAPIVGNTKIKDFADILEEKIKRILMRAGLDEIITYGLIKKNSVEGLGLDEEEIIAVRNPLSIDQEIMRPSMLPGMLGVVSYNLNRKAKRLSLFEAGKIYREKNSRHTEEPVLSACLCGIRQENWKDGKREFDFFDIKGVFERLLSELAIDGVSFKKAEIEGFDRNVASHAERNGKIIARLGEVDKKILEKFDIGKKVFYGELYIAPLLHEAKFLEKKYRPLSKYPSVTRDISVILDENIASSDVIDIVREIGKALVKDASLTDCYSGKQIPKGKRGLLYRIEYRSNEKTLEDAEVDRLHSEIKSALSAGLAVSFR